MFLEYTYINYENSLIVFDTSSRHYFSIEYNLSNIQLFYFLPFVQSWKFIWIITENMRDC